MADVKNEKRLLSKKAVRRAYWDWMFWNLSLQNFERMQGPAIVKMLADVREDLYPGDVEAQKEMLTRHTVFFNTEPNLGAIVPGIVLGMEEEKAAGGDVAPEFINAIKTALMGPFAPSCFPLRWACAKTARSSDRCSTSLFSSASCCR